MQTSHPAPADAHLPEEQICQHSNQWDDENDDHPCNPGCRITMGAKENPGNERQFEQREKNKQRVVGKVNHRWPE
jgi:hypothetical protein